MREEIIKLIKEYGAHTTLAEVLGKETEKAKQEVYRCEDCKNKLCKEVGKGNVKINYLCIISGTRHTMNFEDRDKYSEWHHKHWNKVVING